jgi:N-acetylglucosamine-6-phosphate deacetylase
LFVKAETLRDSFALVNGRIVLPTRVVAGQALIVRNGRIQGVVDQPDPDVRSIDVGGRLITPGLIDIHTHGAQGHTFNQATPAAFAGITQENARRGVTSLLATTMTDALDTLVAVLDFAREWINEQQHPSPSENAQGAQILGVHVEGPYFNQAQRGAQDPSYIRTPDDGTPARLLAYHDIIRIFTYAPELPGALELTRQVAALGLVPAAGHSSAREQDVKPAIDLGLRHMIHLWSSQSTTIREGPWRKPGLLEVSLTDPRLTGEMIADGKHLPPTLMKLAYQCLGPDRLCAISDATSGAGLAEGTHFQLASLNCEVCDGVGMLLDRTAFAGSTTLLNQMLPVLIDQVGIPLPEAVRMVTLTPARVIGVADGKGSLEAGKEADIAIFNNDFTAWGVIIAGQWVKIGQ